MYFSGRFETVPMFPAVDVLDALMSFLSTASTRCVRSISSRVYASSIIKRLISLWPKPYPLSFDDREELSRPFAPAGSQPVLHA